MKITKKTAEYTIFERNDKRYAIRGAGRKWINGEEKIKILEAEGLRKQPEPKQPVEEVAEEADEATAEATEETAKEEEKTAE